MGIRHYPDFSSPEDAIYRDVVDTLKNDSDLNRIIWYYYDYDNDEDIAEEVPPDGKIPAIQIISSNQTRELYSDDREQSVLGLDIITWIDGNHVSDAWGIRHSIYRALLFHKVVGAFSQPWVGAIIPGEIEQVARGLMRSVQTASITYFVENPRN